MKAYKAFEKGMIFRGRQYAEDTVFNEKGGILFYKELVELYERCPLIDENGELTEIAEVVPCDWYSTRDNKNFFAERLKIGEKTDFVELLLANTEKIKNENEHGNAKIARHDDYYKIRIGGYNTQLSASGNYCALDSYAEKAHISSSGYGSRITTRFHEGSYVANSGDSVLIASDGYDDKIANSGLYAKIGSNFYDARIANSGHDAQIVSSGYNARIAGCGGAERIVSNGDNARIATCGGDAIVGSSGENAVICCLGENGKAKAKCGSWITLAEWREIEGEYVPVCVKTEYVDGERIKEDVFYRLQDSEFVEVTEE